ncbi:LysR family transcriptional regulator [Agromyces sp. NPDC049794]|uniref:LysR family transcriptional regulator n=1 Tax=Agromyces sp. NPDC049794 TaxID=3154362 RepID=UPI0033E68C7B
MEPETRLLRYFVAVADELHFGRAAQRLFISQPALSQQIRKLETVLGFDLFDRDRRHVSLTAGGAAILPAARAAVDAAAAVTAEGRRLARDARQTVALGYQVQLPGAVLAAVVRGYRERHPETRVELRQIDFSDSSVGLMSGVTDAAVVSLPIVHQLDTVPLYREGRSVLLPESHPLAGRDTVTLQDLVNSGLRWSHPPDTDPVWRDFWTAAAERRSLGPRGEVEAEVPPTMDSLLATVATGNLLALTHAGLTRAYRHDGVHAVRVTDLSDVSFAAAHRRGEQRPAVRQLIAMLVAHCHRLRTSTP